jgi:hypothetical protein
VQSRNKEINIIRCCALAHMVQGQRKNNGIVNNGPWSRKKKE